MKILLIILAVMCLTGFQCHHEEDSVSPKYGCSKPIPEIGAIAMIGLGTAWLLRKKRK